MRKAIALILTLALIPACFAGCKKKTPPLEDTTNTGKVELNIPDSPASDFEYEENDQGDITVTKYIGTDMDVTIPETIDGKNVTIIGLRAFSENSTIQSVHMPDTVIGVMNAAFYKCSALTTVVLSKNIVKIEESAFNGCSNLSAVTLPEALTKLGPSAFSSCTLLKSVTIPKNISEWGTNIFDSSGVETIIFEDGLETIGESAFIGAQVKEIVLPGSVKTIERGAFSSCVNLETVTLNDGLITIGEGVFAFTKLTEVVIPKSVKKITDSSFKYCSTMEKIKFEGNAPENFISGGDVKGVSYTIYYHEGAEGFTSPEWNGYPTEIW